MNNILGKERKWKNKQCMEFTYSENREIERAMAAGIYNVLDSFKSMIPGSLPCYDEDIIQFWLKDCRIDLFDNTKSKFYGYKQCFKAIAKFWLKYNRHTFGHNDPNIALAQKIWDNYIQRWIIYY